MSYCFLIRLKCVFVLQTCDIFGFCAYILHVLIQYISSNLFAVHSMFLATISSDEISISDGETIPWDSAPINSGDHFDTSRGAYIAPEQGYYQ